eukprot:TRINITY_DN55750_c0_g1_i1.p1 TRINITY_DN55750_c0_g1~~TRINITY_DN55750_c0_g1_i1.p1  ORF type:complete len:350 (+),score=39.83 TRINITY_DN55750_c0_g1_i1:44-1051(+)
MYLNISPQIWATEDTPKQFVLICVFWLLWICVIFVLAILTHTSLHDMGVTSGVAFAVIAAKMIVSKLTPWLLKGLALPKGNETSNTPSFDHLFTFFWGYSLSMYKNFILPVQGNWMLVALCIAFEGALEFMNFGNLKGQVAALATGKDTEGAETMPLAGRLKHTAAMAAGAKAAAAKAAAVRVEAISPELASLMHDTKLPRIKLADFVMQQLIEVLTPLHFAVIFAFDVFGWNTRYMYGMDNVTSDQAWSTLRILLATLLIQTASAIYYIHGLLQPGYLSHSELAFLWELLNRICGMWSLHLVAAMASCTLIVGACMIMKHDGMDLSFQFEWLLQ